MAELDDMLSSQRRSPTKRKSSDLDDEHIIAPHELKMDRKLGAGGFGEVWEATWLTNSSQVAVKKLRADLAAANQEKEKEDFEHELEILFKARHPNILLLMGWNLDPQHLLLVTELMERGSLQSLLDKDATGEFRWGARGCGVAHDVCSGLSFLHSKDIAHLDLKPDNILIDKNNRAKLGDVGLATHLKTEEASMIGTPGYMAPGMFEGGIGANLQVSFERIIQICVCDQRWYINLLRMRYFSVERHVFLRHCSRHDGCGR